ncbi:MAG: L-histidine N-alpha-methyltransferase [Gammaproteobacteria bacterium]|jgi:L-histidine N-alpha-methyltransferase
MQSQQKSAAAETQVTCLVIEPSRTVTRLSDDVRTGLLEVPRSLPPKYFYDERGSLLFDQICTTPEYYPTRTEDELLKQYADSIISETLPGHIIELGSGTSKKTRRLFDACERLSHHCSYAPFDVCEPILELATNELLSSYDWLDVTPMLGDYHAGMANLPTHTGTNLFVFLGSTIGNLEPDEADLFIQDLRNCMSSGDYFLIGADRVKDIEVLNAAYNDSAGITAKFNLNLLRVLNREIGGNFDLSKFRHQAHFNASLGRIEMHLISLENQEIKLEDLDTSFKLERDESILTEISHKFQFEEIESLLFKRDFELVRHYQADNQYFSLLLMRAI